jgi:hypothetical protein
MFRAIFEFLKDLFGFSGHRHYPPAPAPEPIPEPVPVPPPPVPPPVPLPPPDRRPPARPHTRVICLGPYGLMNERDMGAAQWDVVLSDMYNAGYNQLSMFATMPFAEKAVRIHPWPRVGNHFDFTRTNPEYRNHIAVMFDRMAYWRIIPHIKFVDQFHHDKWGANPDPFIDLFGENDNALYSSLDLYGDGKFHWLIWDEHHPGSYYNYRAAPGRAMEYHAMKMFVDMIIDEAQKTRLKWPDFAVSWAWANETRAWVRDDGSQDKARSLGDRDEVVLWVRDLWKAAGFVEGHNLYSYFDYTASINGQPRNWAYDYFAAMFKGIRERNMRLEIHSIFGTDVIKQFIAKVEEAAPEANGIPLDPKYVMWSTDGDMRMIADYRGLGHSKYNVDLKFDTISTWIPGFMNMWKKYFQNGKYKSYING